MSRLLIANLDCEHEFATSAGCRVSPAPSLPKPVRRMIAAAGTLMAAFARPGDVLWTAEPVEPSRIVWEHGRSVSLVSGELPASELVLPWGQTERAHAARRLVTAEERASGVEERPSWPLIGVNRPLSSEERASGVEERASGVRVSSGQGERWVDLLWEMVADPGLVWRCNDRRYWLALAQRFGVALPGTALLSSVAELEAHLAAGHYRHGHRDTWVLKAPFSASGRLRLRRRGEELDSSGALVRAERLFAQYGQLIFEPWMERVMDVGCIGFASPGACQVLAPHLLENDGAGVFRGIAVGGELSWPGEMRAWASAEMRAMASRVAEELALSGYVGPFGIDGFVYRDAEGALQLHPMCEINARLSFGAVAHALCRLHDGQPLRLRLAQGISEMPAGSHVVPLLAPSPADDEPTAAWIELSPHCLRQ